MFKLTWLYWEIYTYNDKEYLDLQVDQTNVADSHDNEQ